MNKLCYTYNIFIHIDTYLHDTSIAISMHIHACIHTYMLVSICYQLTKRHFWRGNHGHGARSISKGQVRFALSNLRYPKNLFYGSLKSPTIQISTTRLKGRDSTSHSAFILFKGMISTSHFTLYIHFIQRHDLDFTLCNRPDSKTGARLHTMHLPDSKAGAQPS